MHHPLDILSEKETDIAREVISAAYPGSVLFFREIYLEEPTKAELIPYLELEHSGKLSPTSPRPRRLAKCQYDVVGSERVPEFHDAIVDVVKQQQVSHTVVGKQHHATLTMYVPKSCAMSEFYC
jgi:primary-amine oxidase